MCSYCVYIYINAQPGTLDLPKLTQSPSYRQPQASDSKHHIEIMAGANWQHSHSHIQTLPQSSSTETPYTCGLIQTNQETTPCRYDRWLKPRPNTMWQDAENQRFVDLSRYDDDFIDEEDYESSDEYEVSDSSHGIPGREERSDSGSEDETHQRPHLVSSVSDRLEITNEVILGTELSSESQLPG